MEELLFECYRDEQDGVLSCYDRIVITGSFRRPVFEQPFCYAQGMTHYLYQQGIRIFDYAQFEEPLRERIRENAEELAQANGVKIEFIRKKDFRWVVERTFSWLAKRSSITTRWCKKTQNWLAFVHMAYLILA